MRYMEMCLWSQVMSEWGEKRVLSRPSEESTCRRLVKLFLKWINYLETLGVDKKNPEEENVGGTTSGMKFSSKNSFFF